MKAFLFSLAVLLGTGAAPATAQFFSPEPTAVQAGLGVVPGTGVQVSYVQPRTTFTLEGAFYADVQSLFDAGEQRFQAAAAGGGALRLLQVLRIVTDGAGASNLDVGLRVGPGVGFEANETRADKNRRFRLLVDPFARYVRPVGGVTLFGEVGLARPRLRAGFWFSM